MLPGNQVAFDMIGSGRHKIHEPSQFEGALRECTGAICQLLVMHGHGSINKLRHMCWQMFANDKMHASNISAVWVDFEQRAAVVASVARQLRLDGILVIGGEDSNTNAAVLR